jgi:3',5'-cyclic AMP phosphodiesterase CpdA
MRLLGVFSVIIIAFISITNNIGLAQDNENSQLKGQVISALNKAPVYGIMATSLPANPESRSPKIPLGPRYTAAPGNQIGSTTRDEQHFCSMGRQIEHRGTNYLHFVWTDLDDNGGNGDVRIAYRAYNLYNCSYMFSYDGDTVNVEAAEFVSLDADSSGCPIPSAHELWLIDTLMINTPRTYWDNACSPLTPPSGNFFSDLPTLCFGWYQNPGIGPGNPNNWPKIEWQYGTGPDPVLHMVAIESGGEHDGPRTISYYQRQGTYGSISPIWSGQRVIDTVMNFAVTLAASPVSNDVAIIWNAPADYKRDTPIEFENAYENDIWYAISTNRGLEWITTPTPDAPSIGNMVDCNSYEGANMTQYTQGYKWKANCDISALITHDTATGSEDLHIVWGCLHWEGGSQVDDRKSAIFHWSENTDINAVVEADWDTGGTCYAHTWGGDVAKMSISQCDNRLYVLYTQFGDPCDPCYDYDAENNILNGELYLTVSTDEGASWDRPQNLTKTETPGCTQGNCESDYWASMARYGRVVQNDCEGYEVGTPVLDILYINDLSPGSSLQAESGISTDNPVMWMTTPCRPAVEPFYFVHISDPHVGSIGADNNKRFDTAVAQINEFDPPPAFVVISGDLVSTGWSENKYQTFLEIASGLNMLYYTCPGNHDGRWFDDYSNYQDSIEESLNYVEYPNNIKLISMQSGYDESCFEYPRFNKWGITFTVPLRVWPDWLPEGEGFSSSQYTWLAGKLDEQPDVPTILFCHHPIVFCSKKKSYNSKEDNCGNGCVWNRRENVWNLLRDPNGDDEYDDAVKVVLSGHTHRDGYAYMSDDWQNAAKLPPPPDGWRNTDCFPDSLPLHINTGSVTANFSYRLIEVDGDQVKVSKIFHFRKPFELQAEYYQQPKNKKIYDKAARQETIWPAGRVHAYDTDTDEHVGINDQNNIESQIEGAYYDNNMSYDPVDDCYIVTGEVISVVLDDRNYKFVCDPLDTAILEVNISFVDENGESVELAYPGIISGADAIGEVRINAGIVNTTLYWDKDGDGGFETEYLPDTSELHGCGYICGDANGDMTVNVGDAVYLISYVFKNGSPPSPECIGDANGDLQTNIGDAVYIIAYVFKGGPAPSDLCCL